MLSTILAFLAPAVIPATKRAKQAPLDETGKQLMRAAKIMRKHGLCKQVLYNKRDQRCTLGAINDAVNKHPGNWVGEYHPTILRVYKQLGVERMYEIAEWNNQPNRTLNEVVSMLESAARLN